MGPNEEITRILQEISRGNRTRINQLIPMVYDELHNIAKKQMYGEKQLETINPTALAHEAYLKLVNQNDIHWNDRCHFFAIAARSMRRIIIDYARAKKSYKRGGNKITLVFAEEELIQEIPADEMLALDEALDRLGELNERQHKVIEYWFFGGLTHQEIAEVLGISVPSVRRDWRLARAWLSRELNSAA
ncbi:MAG: sigma-70 family RNA polymerase sigma factor [Calditrichaceae bacterium]|jgi:RNA polymerase sigma factor (TIGR02999 family)